MPGYDRSRIVGEPEEVLEEFICGICLGVFIKPTVTQCCGQTYCFDCINEWLQKNNTCPNDRGVLTTDQLKPPAKMVTNLLNNMRIKCDFHEKGCKEVVKINDFVKHKENDCVFNPSRYCNNCGEIKLNHSDKDCIERLVIKLDAIQIVNDNLIGQKMMDYKSIQEWKLQSEMSSVMIDVLKTRVEDLEKENAQFKERLNLIISHSEKDSTESSKSKQILSKVAKDDKRRGQLSAYDYFVQSCREEHQKKHPNENVVFAEFSKKCAQQWKAMNDNEKNRFNLLAEEDKKRYEREMAKYMPPLPQKRKREEVSKREPKRALSAYFWFCNDVRTSVKETMNKPTVGEVAKELGRRWKECTEEQKSKYYALADTDRARYEKELKAYKAKKSKGATPAQMKEEYDDDDDSTLPSSSSDSTDSMPKRGRVGISSRLFLDSSSLSDSSLSSN